MAGPLDIQRSPKSLVDLLGMKSTGDSPHILDNLVSGSLELTDLYLADRLKDASWSAAIPIPGAGFLSVPGSGPAAGFIWLVYALDCRYGTVAAAATIQTHLGIQRSSSTCVLLPDGDTGLLAAGATATRGWWWERPLLMRPGDALALQTALYTGSPNITPAGRIYYAELLV